MTTSRRFARSGLATLLAPVTIVTGAFSRAEAQWTTRLDVGSVVRRELPASPTAFPARIDGLVELRGALGTALIAGETISGFRRAGRSDVITSARLRSAAWPWPLGLRLELEGSSAGTRLAEGVRRDRAEVTAGVGMRLIGLDLQTAASRASFERGAVTPHAQRTQFDLTRVFARGLISVGGRSVRYPDAYVTLRDTTYVVAGFPYHSVVERVEPAYRRYEEAVGSVEWWLRAIHVEMHGGLRFVASGVSAERWGRVGLEVPLVRQLSLVAEAGLHGSTPEQRLPSYRFGSLSLRVRRAARAIVVPQVARGADAPSPETGLEMIRSADGSRSLVVRGVAGKRVELMGDFSDWSPVALVSVSPGVWRHDTNLAPGVYHVVMRVDGGAWRPPPGLPVVTDDLELTSGLLVVGP